jgi:hypothetical protein
MNHPIAPGSKQSLGHEYDVVFLPNCQELSDVSEDITEDVIDKPKVQRSLTGQDVKSAYGVAVL